MRKTRRTGTEVGARSRRSAAACFVLALPVLLATAAPKARQDLSGHKRVGTASVYARHLAGKKMADGSRLNPQHDVAASKTLPLGTTAKVTNLETGKSAVVTIKDRGPYVGGRIVDLSPGAAAKVGLSPERGTAQVEVAPIAVPQPDGSVKAGEGK